MPKVALRIVAGGDHMFASTRAAEVAPLISSHFA
jgi:hypothetical protein